MKKTTILNYAFLLLCISLIASCKKENALVNQSNLQSQSTDPSLEKKGNVKESINVSVFASNVRYARGLKFGPDGNLYVALAGVGGTDSTVGQCTQAPGPLGPFYGGHTSSIIRINPQGAVSMVADHLPSQINKGKFTSGVADVEFVGNTLYALLDAGCSHGNADFPTSVIKVNRNNGTWSVVADLTAFYLGHPVAAPDMEDYQLDGTAYSLINVKGDLFEMEPNHGEFDRIMTSGTVSRFIDLSAHYGHIVPTAVAYNDGNFYIGNLGVFPQAAGSSSIYKVTSAGVPSVWATGFNCILGVAFDKEERMYVLETSQAPAPTPNTGKVTRINEDMSRDIIVDKLFFPTGMTFGPDGNLYISETGFGPPTGSILKVTGISSGHHDHDHDRDHEHDKHHNDRD